MATKVTKKRKLLDGTATDTAIELDEYVFTPIHLKTLQKNLESIPHDILIRTLVSIASKDLSFVEKLNEEVPQNMDVNSSTKAKLHHDPDQHLLADKQDSNNEIEARQYSPTKISDYINVIFDAHKFFGQGEDCPYGEEADDREEEYENLLESLRKLMNQTRTLSNIGEQASAYIILRVMYDEIDIDRIKSNGKFDEDEWDELETMPEVICAEIEQLYKQVEAALSAEEKEYCEQRLAAYEAEKPNEVNNSFVMTNFPWDLHYIKKTYPDRYLVSDRYLNRFSIKSKTTPLPRGNNYVVVAQIADPYFGDNCQLELQFSDKKVFSYKCSKHTRSAQFCEHLTGLAVQICTEKTKLLLYMSGQTSIQANVTAKKDKKPTPHTNSLFQKPNYNKPTAKTLPVTAPYKSSVQTNSNYNSPAVTNVRSVPKAAVKTTHLANSHNKSTNKSKTTRELSIKEIIAAKQAEALRAAIAMLQAKKQGPKMHLAKPNSRTNNKR